MDAPTFDLQSHSVHSDGALAPADVVAAAAQAGVELLALTDHDTVSGVSEAIAAGAQHGVRVVAAAELSAVDGGYEDLHVLGYGLDHRDAELLAALEHYRGDRTRRGLAMAEALRELGFSLSEAVLEGQLRDGGSIGRPHLARAVTEHPDNRERLLAESLSDPTLVLQKYLLPGQAAYRARSTPTVAEAIATIHAAGGVAVWAHPFWDLEEPDEVQAAVERFVTSAWTASRRSTSPTTPSRPAFSRRCAMSTSCSVPARPTSTAPTTGCSRSSVPSRCTAVSPHLGPITGV